MTPEIKQNWGPLAYMRCAAQALPELRAYCTEIVLDDVTTLALDVYNVVIANGRYVAGGTLIAPEASVSDGLLDIIIIPQTAGPGLALLAAQIALGQHLTSEAIVFRRAAKVTVRFGAGHVVQCRRRAGRKRAGHVSDHAARAAISRSTRVMKSNILKIEELADVAEVMRAEGKVLVATNGCFDLLHVGHVRYLQAARRLGDALAVGVNGDASVRSLKGEGRPLNNERDRAEVLSALACVDYVCIFPDVRATAFLEKVRPAIYVKGGDYTPDTLNRRGTCRAGKSRNANQDHSVRAGLLNLAVDRAVAPRLTNGGNWRWNSRLGQRK